MEGLQTLLVEVARSGIFGSYRPPPASVGESRCVAGLGAGLCVDVQYEGNASAWMLAADVVLHPGCTTGIEALLLDRPVVSFVPEPKSEFVNQADAISLNVASAAELLALASTCWETPNEGERNRVRVCRSAMRAYVDNVEPPLAADRDPGCHRGD